MPLEDLLGISDVMCVANDDEECPAHKLILMSRSEIFRAMFQNDAQYPDLAGSALMRLPMRLCIFASTSTTMILIRISRTVSFSLWKLFGLGDLYSLPRLKAQIEAEMKETLSVKNVAGRLMMSVRHNSPLTEACTDFVRANLKEMIKTKDWAEVTKDASVMASLIALEKVYDDDGADSNTSSKREGHI